MHDEAKKILELFSQPAFLANEREVIWCNTAAGVLVQEGTALVEIMEEHDALFSRWSGEGVAQIPLLLRGRVYETSVRKQDDCLLFVLAAPSEKSATAASAVLNASACLRKPLHSLLSAATELFERIDVSGMKDTASQINRAIYQLMRLCGQMSDGSRLILQKMQAYRRPTDMQRFFELFLQQVRPLIEAAGRSLQYTPLDTSVKADIDAALIERALLNLISNALAYTPIGGTISLKLQLHEKRLLVTISDDGEGISTEVFGGAMCRGEQMSADPRWGLGYGLQMVRQIAREHDGSMMIAANESGKGTSVVFSISLAPTALSLHSPILTCDYCGGLNHALVELSDALGKEHYDPQEI